MNSLRQPKALKIALKVPCPPLPDGAEWGEYHLGQALQRALESVGHKARLDTEMDWYAPMTEEDEIVFVIRAHKRYWPLPGRINIFWGISHPFSWSRKELESYDHVFTASAKETKRLNDRYQLGAETLFQFTEQRPLDSQSIPEDIPAEPFLFVGSAKGEYRENIRFAVEADLPLGIYGSGWDNLIPNKFIRGNFIANKKLHFYYAKSKLVLNDHYKHMREHGFINNRTFDVGANGALLLSDDVAGLKELYGDIVPVYRSAAELKELVTFYLSHEDERQEKARQFQEITLRDHTVASRVVTILETVEKIRASRPRQGNRLFSRLHHRWNHIYMGACYNCTLLRQCRNLGRRIKLMLKPC
jgi:hypothetical protein